MNEQSDVAKEHYVEIVNLRKQLGEMNDQIALCNDKRLICK